MKPEELREKLKIYSYVVAVFLTLLLIKLSVLQIYENEMYQTQAKENRVRLVPIKAARGEIYGRDGEVLAANELVYTVSINYIAVSQQEMVVNNLVELLQEDYPEVTAQYITEKIELQQFRLFEPVVIVRDIPWELVVKLEEHRQDLPGVTIDVEPLRYYPQGSLAGHALGYIHSISSEELAKEEEDYKYSINSLIGKSGIEKQYEKELRGKDGAQSIEVDARGRPVPTRDTVTLEPEQGYNIYLTLDTRLQKVMELSMEEMLVEVQKKHPKATVASAVLMNVKTGEVLAMASSPAMYPDDWKGNLSSERASYYFPQGSAYDPMDPGAILNRCIQVSYAPGSTFKPVTGMAALEIGAMDPLKEMVTCRGSYWIAPNIPCWSVHGNVNYYSGMAGSCNTYFQEMGRRAGVDEIARVASEAGLGSLTGIDLPGEITGLLPTRDWKFESRDKMMKKRYESEQSQLQEKYDELIKNESDPDKIEKLEKEREAEKSRLEGQYRSDYNWETQWQSYDTFNMSIGEGFNSYTVIQLANYISALANGGHLMQPYLVDRIEAGNDRIIKKFEPRVKHEMDVKPQTLAETRKAMLAVTQPGGTGYYLFSQFPAEIQVGAKTGTAEVRNPGASAQNDYNGVFVAFAPYDDPEIAFAGIVEYGNHGSESAGLVARKVFEQYFGLVDYLAVPEEETKQNNNMSNGIDEE